VAERELIIPKRAAGKAVMFESDFGEFCHPGLPRYCDILVQTAEKIAAAVYKKMAASALIGRASHRAS
jgi:hypothetical protein